jgi:hypothetical protein
LRAEQKDQFIEFLAPHGNFGHEVAYIVQEETELYSDAAVTVPMTTKSGNVVFASAGPARLQRHFRPSTAHAEASTAAPSLLWVVDGNKTGFNYGVLRQVEREIQNQNIVVLVRKLAADEAEREQKQMTEGRPRYARVTGLRRGGQTTAGLTRFASDSHTRVCDPDHRESYAKAPDWIDAHALCGIYLTNPSAFLQEIQGIREDDIPRTACRSVDSMHAGQARILKIPMCLEGYPKTGCAKFTAVQIQAEQYAAGLKEAEDLHHYRERLTQGHFDYRRSLELWKRRWG